MSTTNTEVNSELNISDAQLEKMLKIVSHYVFSELDEVVPFDSKSDEERDEIMKLVVKTIETSVIVSNELHNASSLNDQKVDTIVRLFQESKFDEAYGTLKS